jgi:hypothetical protein|tara:strand:- start:1608 stop:2189 length:582 start_codon:yes stop_codon:yes gene_type:complete
MNFIEEYNHSLIPKTMLNADAEDLETYVQKTGDIDFAYAVLGSINDLLQQLSKIKSNDLRLSAKINSKNILVSNDKPYFIGEIEWAAEHEVFKIIMSTNMDICNSLQTSLLLYESTGWRDAAFTPEDLSLIEKQKGHIKNLETKIDSLYDNLHEKNEEIFEKGVRHGFWNVKTKEEIKEKYENYKHLEDWHEL